MSANNRIYKRVAILAAMASELKPIIKQFSLTKAERKKTYQYSGQYKHLSIVAAMTKMGLENAENATRAILQSENIDHLILVGIAGANLPELNIGQVVRTQFVIDQRDDSKLPVEYFGLSSQKGVLYSSDETNYDKKFRDMLDAKNVIAADMEAGPIANMCKEFDCTFTVIKAISDRIGKYTEPYEVFELAHDDGSPNFPKAIKYVLTKPHRWGYLVNLSIGTYKAIQSSAKETFVILDKIASTGNQPEEVPHHPITHQRYRIGI